MRLVNITARKIYNSRKEETIEVAVKTEYGCFLSSAPGGKSKGKNENPSFIGSVEDDIHKIKKFSSELCKLDYENFFSLEKVEEIVKGKIGASSLFALESGILKAMAAENKVPLWKFLNERAKRLPRTVGNCIGGGLHSSGKKPDFQEFLVIPHGKRIFNCIFLMKEMHNLCGKKLSKKKARGKPNDEGAWSTTLSNEEVLEIMNEAKEDVEKEFGEKINLGLDIASSVFYTGYVYKYKNKPAIFTKKEQINYILDIVKKFNLKYLEDPLHEEDFSGFSELKAKIGKKCLVVGDDLIVSKIERLKKAILFNSVNAIIVKPNQVGSLLDIYELIRLCKEKEILTIMSHRSGETMDFALADFAFAFECDLIKAGIFGKEREVKLKRLIEIERSLR